MLDNVTKKRDMGILGIPTNFSQGGVNVFRCAVELRYI